MMRTLMIYLPDFGRGGADALGFELVLGNGENIFCMELSSVEVDWSELVSVVN